MAVGHVYSCKSSSPYYVTRFFWLHKIVQNHTKLLQKTDIHWSNFPKNCQSFPFGLVVSNICVFSTPTYLGKKIQFDKSIFQMGTQNDTAAQLGPMEWFGTQNKSSAASRTGLVFCSSRGCRGAKGELPSLNLTAILHLKMAVLIVSFWGRRCDLLVPGG